MKLKEAYKKAGPELKERLDPKTTHPFWAKVRNVSGSIASGGVIALQVLPPGKTKLIVGIVTAVSTAISGTAWLDKSKNSGNKFKVVKDILNLITKKK